MATPLGHRFAGLAVADQLDAEEESLATNLADQRVFSLQAQQAFEQVGADFLRILQQAFPLDDPQVLQRCGGAGGTATEGADVTEVDLAVVRLALELFEHLFCGHRAGDGGIPGRHALGHGDDVRLDAVVLVGEPLAGAAQAANHLIDVNEDVVLAADRFTAFR